jgi:hypothetical protein
MITTGNLHFHMSMYTLCTANIYKSPSCDPIQAFPRYPTLKVSNHLRKEKGFLLILASA